MQKKKIMAVEIAAQEQTEGWYITGVVKIINHMNHFIGDIYHDAEYAARLAINKDDYAIFDVAAGRWTRQSPWYTYLDTITQSIDWDRMECERKTREKIAYFTKSRGNPGEAIQDKMKAIWNRKSAEKEAKCKAKETSDLAMTPEIPPEFDEWTETLFKDAGNIMFYKRDTSTTARICCGVCGKERKYTTSDYGEPLTIQPPRAEGIHTCRECGATGVYKQAGRIKRDMWTRTAYLFQNTPDGGIVIRMFKVTREQEQGYAQYYRRTELMRAYLNKFKAKQYYWHTDYLREKEGYWSRYNKNLWGASISFTHGEIYPAWREVLRQSDFFRYCDLELYRNITEWKKLLTTDIIQILKAYANMPQIELMAKMGLHTLADRAIWYQGTWRMLNKKAKDAAGFLKIEKYRLKGIGDVNVPMLQALQFEKKQGIRLDEEMLSVLEVFGTNWEDTLLFITRFMSLKKAVNRIQAYARNEYHDNASTARIEYADYLGIREELGYDMTNSIYLHPKSLRTAHQEMVKEKQRRENDLHIKKMLEKYPKIVTRYEALCKKYHHEKDGFLIRPAKDAEEIIMEGRLLHHCVGRETYLSKHNDGKSTILFLRKAEEPEIPYITIEINGKDIVQWYGAHDEKPDKENMQKWIDDYVEYLKNKQKQKKREQQIAIQVQQTLKRAAG